MKIRFSHHLILGAVSAALLAACSGGSQFAPAATGSQPGTMQVASAAHDAGGVRPDYINVDEAVVSGGQICYYVTNTQGQQVLLYCRSIASYGYGMNLILYGTIRAAVVGFKNNTLGIYGQNGKLVTTLTGLTGVATGIVADKKGDIFATNAGSTIIDYFAAGETTPTEVYSDPDLSSASYLAMDKAGNVYVEGQAAGGTGIEVDELSKDGAFRSLAQPGALGVTAGGVAAQTVGKATYVWINDQGSGSSAPSIARYVLKGTELAKQGSFTYSGLNGAIAVDPSGKDPNVYAVNNAASGSEYAITGVAYSYPSGAILSMSAPQTASQPSIGIALR